MPGGYGGYFVDDEGQPASPTCIIRDGIFQRGLTDLYSATRLGIPRSANGRRESVAPQGLRPHVEHVLRRGTSTREEVLASLDDGLLVCRAQQRDGGPEGLGHPDLDQLTPGSTRGASRPGVLYAPVAMTGYVPDVLADVSMVANDFEITPGTCGKGWKELVPNGSGGPHIKTRMRLA